MFVIIYLLNYTFNLTKINQSSIIIDSEPRIIFDERNNDLRDYINHKNEKPNESLPTNLLLKN